MAGSIGPVVAAPHGEVASAPLIPRCPMLTLAHPSQASFARRGGRPGCHIVNRLAVRVRCGKCGMGLRRG
jgi:hypothetical protein